MQILILNCHCSVTLPQFGLRRIAIREIAPYQRRFFTGRHKGQGKETSGQELAIEDADYKGALNILNRYQSQVRQVPAYPSRIKSVTATERTRIWLRLLGHDVDQIQTPKVIHVAGTKGKGTTCYYCNRILVEHQKLTGYPQKIGCLTSPHQVDICERILINNEKISRKQFSKSVRELDSKINSLSSQLDLEVPRAPGFPGFLSLLAINHFLDEKEKFDVVILETGIGGETDSTNVFPHPIATGITTIALDHVEVLGNTVEEIAWHKAGIFKSGSLAGSVPQGDAVLQVLRRRAEERNIAGELQVITDREVLRYGVKVDPDMPYQRYNAGLAMFLAEEYLKSENPSFSMTGDIARSLQNVELLGKSQVLREGSNTWFISSGHNELSVKETISWFKRSIQSQDYTSTPRVLVFNTPRDPSPLLRIIHDGLCADDPVVLRGVIFCTDQLGESVEDKPDLIDLRMNNNIVSSLNKQRDNSRVWKELGGSGEITVVHTTRDAVRLIRENYEGAEVLVTGSSYLSGNVLYILRPAI